MDECYISTALLLVYLAAVVDSQFTYMCQIDDGMKNGNKKNPDLSLEFPSDSISDTTSTKHYLCNVTTEEPFKKMVCNTKESSCPILCSDAESDLEWLPHWSVWTGCAMSNGKEIMYRYRDVTTASGEPICCLTPCSSLVDKQDCPLHAVSSATGKENCKEDEKRYTLTEIILLALGCFLMGVLLTALLLFFYMKRRQKGCFSKHIKEVQGDSKQQSGPDLQFLTERVVVKKYDPKTQKSEDSKNETKSDEIQYQSLNTNQIDNDQQTYDELKVKKPRSDRHGNRPSSSRLQQSGNDDQIDYITNLHKETEGVYEYSRDSDLGGHNYFILESENISPESKDRNLGRPETHAEVGDEVKDLTLGTEDKQSDAAP